MDVRYCPITKKTSVSFNLNKSCCCKKKDDCCSHKKIIFKKIKDSSFEKSEIKILNSSERLLFGGFLKQSDRFTYFQTNTLAVFSFQNNIPLGKKLPLPILYRIIP